MPSNEEIRGRIINVTTMILNIDPDYCRCIVLGTSDGKKWKSFHRFDFCIFFMLFS